MSQVTAISGPCAADPLLGQLFGACWLPTAAPAERWSGRGEDIPRLGLAASSCSWASGPSNILISPLPVPICLSPSPCLLSHSSSSFNLHRLTASPGFSVHNFIQRVFPGSPLWLVWHEQCVFASKCCCGLNPEPCACQAHASLLATPNPKMLLSEGIWATGPLPALACQSLSRQA